jgi:hypothetical protein
VKEGFQERETERQRRAEGAEEGWQERESQQGRSGFGRGSENEREEVMILRGGSGSGDQDGEGIGERKKATDNLVWGNHKILSEEYRKASSIRWDEISLWIKLDLGLLLTPTKQSTIQM